MYSNTKNYVNIYNCLRVSQQNKNRKIIIIKFHQIHLPHIYSSDITFLVAVSLPFVHGCSNEHVVDGMDDSPVRPDNYRRSAVFDQWTGICLYSGNCFVCFGLGFTSQSTFGGLAFAYTQIIICAVLGLGLAV